MRKINMRGVVCWYLKDNIFSIRCIAAFVLVMSYYFPYLITIMRASDTLGIRMHISGIFLMIADPWNTLVFFLGFALLLANVPFFSNLQIQIILRFGKLRWLLSQVVYLFCLSIFYLIMIISGCLLVLFNSITVSNNWGKILGGLSRGNKQLLELFPSSLKVYKSVITNYSANQYFAIMLCLIISLLFIISMVVLVSNLFIRRLGFFLLAIILFLTLFVYSSQGYMLYFVSPLTWISIHLISLFDASNMPTWFYVITILSLSFIILIILVLLKGRKNSKIDI